MKYSCGNTIELTDKLWRKNVLFRALLDDLSVGESYNSVEDGHDLFDMLGDEDKPHLTLGLSQILNRRRCEMPEHHRKTLVRGTVVSRLPEFKGLSGTFQAFESEICHLSSLSGASPPAKRHDFSRQ